MEQEEKTLTREKRVRLAVMIADIIIDEVGDKSSQGLRVLEMAAVLVYDVPLVLKRADG